MMIFKFSVHIRPGFGYGAKALNRGLNAKILENTDFCWTKSLKFVLSNMNFPFLKGN